MQDEYLRQFNGSRSISNEWHIIKDGTFTAISAPTNTATIWTLEIRKKDGISTIASLNLNSAEGNHNTNLSMNATEGDFLKVYYNGTDISDPQALIEIAWRK